MNKMKKTALGLLLIISLIVFFLIRNSEKEIPPSDKISGNSQTITNLPAKISEQDGISFEITPIDFNFNEPIKFEIKIDTHSGSLDLDLVKISLLEDDGQNQYKPVSWQGSSAGGHHRSGIGQQTDKEY